MRYPPPVWTARRAASAMISSALLAACGGPPGGDGEAAECELGPPLPGLGGGAVAVNAYYLQEEAARALRLGRGDAPVVDEVLRKAAALGASFVRTNGFNDDPAKAGDSAIQVAPLSYDEAALRGLDLVLARAHAHGVRLVLPLGNYWDDYGGARQYVAWAGLPSPRRGDARFFTDPGVVRHYRAHVAGLLSRVNTFDGLRYGEHPAVLAWELLNEPRGDGLDAAGAAMRAWVDELGAAVKALAPGHLVGTGEEGLDAPGSRFARNTASPWVDYGSVHLFPEPWGVAPGATAGFGTAFIARRGAEARAAGKPLLVGELGLRNDGLPLEARRETYRRWLECARRAGAGAAIWLFANDGRPDAWDPYTFRWIDGTAPADPANRYADLVQEAAAARRPADGGR
ncbi:MAG: cellulase family glycosylhydrolase [Anaeromyxobacteraceae bacterium]